MKMQYRARRRFTMMMAALALIASAPSLTRADPSNPPAAQNGGKSQPQNPKKGAPIQVHVGQVTKTKDDQAGKKGGNNNTANDPNKKPDKK